MSNTLCSKDDPDNLCNDLGPEHLDRFHRALSSVLFTIIAERTFAQTIDGLPTREDIGFFPVYSKEMEKNALPPQDALEAARAF